MQDPDRHDPQASEPQREEALLGESERLGADLVHAVCDPDGFAAELAARRDDPDAFLEAPEVQRELAAVRALVGTARASAATEPAGASEASERLRRRRVANRVLARTTREDRGWRGDVRLWADFVSDRLRDSALLRFAAALLLVQVTVVPMLAYHVLREWRAPELTVTIDKSRGEAPPEWAEDDEAEIEAEPTLDEADLDALAAAGASMTDVARLDALARAARQRLRALDAEPTTPAGLAVLLRLSALEARLVSEPVDPRATSLPFEVGAATRGDRAVVERIAFEAQLDRVAIQPDSARVQPSDSLARRLAAAPAGTYGAWLRERAVRLGCWPADGPAEGAGDGLDPVLGWAGAGATPVADPARAAWLEAWASR